MEPVKCGSWYLLRPLCPRMRTTGETLVKAAGTRCAMCQCKASLITESALQCQCRSRKAMVSIRHNPTAFFFSSVHPEAQGGPGPGPRSEPQP